MSQAYKAIAYKVAIHIPADSECHIPAYTETETRYKIVSLESGEVLDDAQGYGYRTAKKAYAAYAFKHRDPKKAKERAQKDLAIKKWLNEHQEFSSTLEGVAFEIAKGSWGPDDKFDSKLVATLLTEFDLKPDFSAFDILRVWKKG